MADESDQQLSQGLLANAATDPLAEGEYLELEGRGGGGGTSEAEAHVHTQGSHPAAAEGPPRPPPAAPPDGDGVGYAGAAADAIAPAESGAGGAAGPARVDELSVNLDGGTDDDLSPGPAVAGRAASHGAARRWALWRTTTAPTTKVPRSASNKIKLLNLVRPPGCSRRATKCFMRRGGPRCVKSWLGSRLRVPALTRPPPAACPAPRWR